MNDVKTTVIALARLQELESTLAAVDAESARVPGRIAKIERTLAQSEKALQTARTALQEGGKTRRILEQEIEVIKVRIARYQDQTLQVKTNDQYRALNKEISAERALIEGIEEKILINMKAQASKWTGTIHDPDSGRNYDSTIAMKGSNALRVQGCAFGGMFCGGQTWSRVN